MLTGPAFNALLKTLEEPPAHAVFVLATTEYEKLPATITSRTQRFLFKKLSKTKILEKITLIAKAEHIQIEPSALELIAAASEGSFRDAESLLDQIASLTDKIDLAAVERITGRTGLKKVDGLAELILKNDLKKSLEYLAQVNDEGYNLIQFTRDLIHYLRKTLSIKVSPGVEESIRSELTSEEIARVKELSTLVSPEALVRVIKALILAYTEMRYSPFAFVPLEVALVENLRE
jgi:DNA polymerase III subunit gamma/tau